MYHKDKCMKINVYLSGNTTVYLHIKDIKTT